MNKKVKAKNPMLKKLLGRHQQKKHGEVDKEMIHEAIGSEIHAKV